MIDTDWLDAAYDDRWQLTDDDDIYAAELDAASDDDERGPFDD